MKILTLLIAFSSFFLCSCINQPATVKSFVKDTIPPIDKSLATKPPMGWNSWDCYGWAINEQQVKASAEYMKKNLQHLGYEYIVIDMLWYGDSAASSFEDFVHERIATKPNYNIDNYGRVLPDTSKFPSAKNGNGFKPLADYIHSLGLKFGIHVLRGIPWQAADKNLPVMNSSYGAASIAQPDKGCEWYDGFYGVDMTKPGAQEYYNSIFKLYASWGVDFVKADDLIALPELEAISKALRTSGRKMILSVVPDGIPDSVLRNNVHMARTGFDFWDVWEMLKRGFPAAATAVKEGTPGYWPDLDMLPIGKIGIKISYKGPHPRISNFTNDELHTLFSLWYISRMPLMIGGYLPETDAATLELLQNKEALEVNRNSINNRQIKFKNAVIIWAADIPNSTDKYVAFFNPWESLEPVDIKVSWQQLGLIEGAYKVRDLWGKKDLGVFNGSFHAPVNAHGAGLYRVSK